MNWAIEFSREADKFLRKNPGIETVLLNEIKKLIRKLNGETVSINFKKLHGEWSGYYRIRKNNIRIILTIKKHIATLTIFDIDFRGDVYK